LARVFVGCVAIYGGAEDSTALVRMVWQKKLPRRGGPLRLD
jgi:hypothetical protein